MKTLLLSLFFLLTGTGCATAQQNKAVQINGYVYDSISKLPLDKVLVTNARFGNTTYSDAQGFFKINISLGDTLWFHSGGMHSQWILPTGVLKSPVNIWLSPLHPMEEVLVQTGYQSIPRERATGSFDVVEATKLQLRTGSDILSRLEGTTTALLFDRRAMQANEQGITANDLSIRGISTLTSSIKAPLVVVDNFPYDGDINNITPNDVESVTLLKDAAAASIWGARAGNGVIVIVTKRGHGSPKPRFTLQLNSVYTEKPDLFAYPSMSTADYIEVESFLFAQGYYNSNISNTTTYPALTPVVEMLAACRSGGLGPADSAALMQDFLSGDVRHDFEKYIYRPSWLQQYAGSMNGGNEAARYYIGAGYDNSTNALVGNGYHRASVRSRLDLKLSSHLQASLGTAYSHARTDDNSLGNYGNSNYNYRSGRPLYPYARLADDNGNPLSVVHDYRLGYVDTAGGGLLRDWNFRPLEELGLADKATTVKDLVLNGMLRYQAAKGVALQANYQFEQSSSGFRNYMAPQSYYVRNLVNLFSVLNNNSVTYNLPNGGILHQSGSQLTAHHIRGQVNIDRRIGRGQLNAVTGGEINEDKTETYARRLYGFSEEYYTFSNVDYLTFFPQYGGRGTAQVPNADALGKYVNRFVSYYANAAYSYQDKYILSGSFRKDASNLFGVSTNNKWKPLWSVGGSWEISREPFYSLVILPYLRIRTSFGYQGNVNNAVSPLMILTWNAASASLINQPNANISTPADKDLSWESVKQLNIGMDFRSKDQLLSGSLEYYHKNSNNLILGGAIDPTTGFSSVVRNSADMSGHGVDLKLDMSLGKRDWKWRPSILFSYAKNTVKDYLLNDVGRAIYGFVSSSGNTILPVKGANPYEIYSYPFLGLEPSTGNPIGRLNQMPSQDYYAILRQSIDTADLIRNGSALPLLFGFFNNSVSYKSWTLTLSISYKFKYFFRKATVNYYSLFSSGAGSPDYSKRWKNPGDEQHTSVPSMIYPLNNTYRDEFYAGAEPNVLRGDHIRLQYIRLDYGLPTPYKHVLSMGFFVSLANPGMLWHANREGLDPDYNYGNAVYPPMRSFSMGLNLSF